MKPKGPCIVTDCDTTAFCRGYCKRHYGQLWRNGVITTTEKVTRSNPAARKRQREIRIEKIKRQLNEARDVYQLAGSLSCRLIWAQKIKELCIELDRLENLE